MLKAKDFRKYAREALAGKWLKAGAVGVLASMLGATIGTNSVSVSGSTESETLEAKISELFSLNPEVSATVVAVTMGVLLLAVLWAIAVVIIGGATTLGYAKYNLNLVDGKEAKAGDLFSQYNRLGTGFGMEFFRTLYVSLWSILFVIPGLIARFSYYMTPFILCENPDMTARQAIKASKELMKGNKWRLFCLQFSFLGWYAASVAVFMVAAIIASLISYVNVVAVNTMNWGYVIIIAVLAMIYLLGIGFALLPYETAATAVFYREICREKYAKDYIEAETADYVYESVPEEVIEITESTEV